jgi:hypothetical protein
MRKKMPARPYYGELEVGETFPSQKKKTAKKPVKKTAIKKVSSGKPKGIGKKVVGEIKSAQQKKREAQSKLLESMD